MLTLLGVLIFVENISAQTTQLYIKTQTEDGRDSVMYRRVKLKSQTPYQNQQRIGVLLRNDSVYWFTPDDVTHYRTIKKHYESIEVPRKDGKMDKLFLRRVYHKPKHHVAIYLYQDSLGNKTRYWKQGNMPLQLIVDGEREENPLKAYLWQFPLVEQSDLLQQYIGTMLPEEKSFHKRARICWTNNLNYIPRWRWGMSTSANFNSVTMNDIKGSQVQAAIALWTDIPLFIYGLTFHPELSFNKFSAVQTAQWDTPIDVAYNNSMINLPIMLRYTAVPLRGKVLPYIEGGISLNFSWKNKYEVRYFERDEESFVTGYITENWKGKTFGLGYQAGGGLEIKLTPYRSLWLGARYYKHLIEKMYSYDIAVKGLQVYTSVNF